MPQASTFDGGKRRTSRSKAVTGVSFVSILAGTSCHDFLWCATRTRNACFVDVQDGCPGREPVSPGQAEVRVGKESDVRNEDARSVGRLEDYIFSGCVMQKG